MNKGQCVSFIIKRTVINYSLHWVQEPQKIILMGSIDLGWILGISFNSKDGKTLEQNKYLI